MKTDKSLSNCAAPIFLDADNTHVEPYLKALKAASVTFDETLLVVDFKRRCFRFVSDRGIFLCGYTSEEMLQLGFDFYKKAIHKQDYPQFEIYLKAVEDYFYHPKTTIQDIAYAVFDFKTTGYMKKIMLSHKFMPLIVNNEERLAVCSVSRSAGKTQGNLYTYYYNVKDNVRYLYSFGGKKWEPKPMTELSQTEWDILNVAKQGLTGKETSKIIGISHQYMRNTMTPLFERLDVDNMTQAFIYVQNHQVNVKNDGKVKNKPRRKMTEDKLLRIQASLNNGESYRSIERMENVDESTIRYHIRIGNLKK